MISFSALLSYATDTSGHDTVCWIPSAHEPRLPPYCRPTRSKIIRARFTLSDTTAVRRGDGRLISGSRARRTAAMIAAAMTSVDFIRVCSCIFSAQASRSRAIARFISPISAPRIARAWAKFVRKLAAKDLGWKIASLLAAERTLRGNPGIRHRAHRRRNVFTAILAADREVAVPGLRNIEHELEYRRTKGETAMWISADRSSRRSPGRDAADLTIIVSNI